MAGMRSSGLLRMLREDGKSAVTLQQADEKGIAHLILHAEEDEKERVALRATNDLSALWVGASDGAHTGHLTLVLRRTVRSTH